MTARDGCSSVSDGGHSGAAMQVLTKGEARLGNEIPRATSAQ